MHQTLSVGSLRKRAKGMWHMWGGEVLLDQCWRRSSLVGASLTIAFLAQAVSVLFRVVSGPIQEP